MSTPAPRNRITSESYDGPPWPDNEATADTLAGDIGDAFRQQRSPYAPKRQRSDRKQEVQQHQPKQDILPPPPPPVPATPDIADNAARYFTMVANLQNERDNAVRENAELKARLEQYQATVTDLRSQVETSRLETSDANRRTDEAREAGTRLKAILENIGGLVTDGLQ